MKTPRQFFAAILSSAALISGPLWTSFAAESLGGISLNEISPRIITPNGDQLNDVAFFRFSDSIVGIPLETNVVDINGAKVAELQAKPGIDDVLVWDGKDSGGRDVPSGIYIYSIKLGEHLATGTLVVAR